MPTHDETENFWREFAQLSPEDQQRFLGAVSEFIRLLKAGVLPMQMPSHFGIKRFRSRTGELWEFRWGADRRALFRYGTSPNAGDVHIIWESIGTHGIYKG